MRQDRDPLVWSILIALAFLALALHRLATPSAIYFDEVHYVPAARKLLELVPANREHPMFAKEVIAGAIALFGDRPLAWRLPAALFGAFGLFAFGRLTWHLSHRRFAALSAMVLLASGFAWFVQSRIAMLDIFAASLILVGLWQFAAAMRGVRSGQVRVRLMLAGIATGLAMASKWNVMPIALLPGLTFAILRLTGSGKPRGWSRITLVEAAVWLGIVPLAVYWLSFAPEFLYAARDHPVSPFGFIEQHERMIALQDSVVKHHTYQSTWRDWVIDRRPIWYLYEQVDGAQRGIIMLGNPLTMLAGLAALAWCAWAGLVRKRYDALAFAVLYAASLSLWILAPKPVQFYYHYLLPGTFLLGALALALDEIRQKGAMGRWVAWTTLAASLALFGWFYPILSAAPLADGEFAFAKWMWFGSWR